ncbi:adenylyl-sulfate kinase [Meiothermus sp. QL-1]|uniref:adenylyl-sulfate kinase n=1 Tax=Meiothermus sp. QL-1 TaxID=2058095 RepID=UPI000E0C566F|nr:adenylyl-sulfate kinase [Meiothermus sp. QL-1]RDI94466.1 adenylyl-sulfate kinase [Meiothermus sp. QL-1]
MAERRNGLVVWFTGLSGAGKTTLAQALHKRLEAAGYPTELLDGDEVREHLSKGLGFSREDRDTNIRRIGYVANLLAKHGVVVLVSAISPYRATREEVLAQAPRKLEVFVDAPLEVVARRDVKGLYARALRGEIPQFTGVNDPYEPPLHPDLHLRTDQENLETCLKRLIRALEPLGIRLEVAA